MTTSSVGFISPFPPTRSGIADYSKELLPALRELLTVEAYEPETALRALGARHDALIFEIGNDPLHAPSVEALANPSRRTPAVVVLHDFVLHHLFAAAYLSRGNEETYDRELVRAHGERGRHLAASTRGGPRPPVWDLDPWAFPMSAGVLADADAVIVHSRLVRGAVLRESPGRYVAEIPLHVFPAVPTARREARKAFDLPIERPVAVTLGAVTPTKRVDRILEALSRMPPPRRPLLFVGGAIGSEDPLNAKVSELGLRSDVRFSGYLTEEEFWLAACAADVAINLRYPTMGETSGSVCRLAGLGVPIVVSDLGWFRELPDSFASKVPVGEGEVEALAEALFAVAFDPVEREKRAEAARAWSKERSPALIALRYAAVIDDVTSGRAASRSLSGFLASALLSVGVGRPGGEGRLGHSGRPARSSLPDATLTAAVARRLAFLKTAEIKAAE